MPTVIDSDDGSDLNLADPRDQLANWANECSEWARLLVGEVLSSSAAVSGSIIDAAYSLMRQESGMDPRIASSVEPLRLESSTDDTTTSLRITKISNVSGVNALTSDAEIEFCDGLTILYGENGTGKTGYSRILKAMAASRTADVILGDVLAETPGPEAQSAEVTFELGGELSHLVWQGQFGVDPFQRMLIFDSKGVVAHVDDTLEYVYTPSSLTPFSAVIDSLQALSERINDAISALAPEKSPLTEKFDRGTTIRPLIEGLSSSTDLEQLRPHSRKASEVQEEMDRLRIEIATLRSDSIDKQISGLYFYRSALKQALEIVDKVRSFDCSSYNSELLKNASLKNDREFFRREFFEAAHLPGDPDERWEQFVSAGEDYRASLVENGVYDETHCLYCRQSLDEEALELIRRYRSYLEDQIADSIRKSNAVLANLVAPIQSLETQHVDAYLATRDGESGDEFLSELRKIKNAVDELRGETVTPGKSVTISHPFAGVEEKFTNEITSLDLEVRKLEDLQQDAAQAHADKSKELAELGARVALNDNWQAVEAYVLAERERGKLNALRNSLAKHSRSVTQMMKVASQELLNRSFDTYFQEECAALRAPKIRVEFSGRKGKAQRKKLLSGKYKPSIVFSEGEQKVLALADFLAEARVGGIAAPVVFDDPVSSLDHRRIDEVATRITALAESSQVIVFTHDILFATRLIQMMEQSKRVAYYQISDENGKGHVSRGTGPRFDSLGNIKSRVNVAIQKATQADGEERDSYVRAGYSHLRSWCEVFVETDLLKGVTRRYQPNVHMTTLAQINFEKFDEIATEVVDIYEKACRFIDAHSQPFATQGVSPTLSRLQDDWQKAQQLKKKNAQVRSS